MFYPVFIDLQDRSVLVVGGGVIAERKTESLLEAGARVTVVSPSINPRLRDWNTGERIAVRLRRFEPEDLDGMLLVISATDDSQTQESVAQAAASRNVMVNTVDRPALCDFVVPAVVRRGDVLVAISTSGKSPALSAALRRMIGGLVTDEVARTANVLGSVRTEVHERVAGDAERKRVFEQILESGIVDWIGRCDDATAIERVRKMIDEYV